MTPNNHAMLDPGESAACLATFTHRGMIYEQRLVDCGKANCTRCTGPDRRRPTHGPYWYLCFMARGRWRRLYIGKELDTQKYRLENGGLDWHAIHEKKRRPAPAQETTS